jgi:hypothetical protein
VEEDNAGMADANSNSRSSKWLSITIPLLSAAFAVLGFVYFVGQRGGKIAEVVDWKTETAPRIERMDAKGTNSFEIFHDEYLRRQVRQESQLNELEKDIHDKEIEDLKERVLTLERKPCP